jgi:hypothetical protein
MLFNDVLTPTNIFKYLNYNTNRNTFNEYHVEGATKAPPCEKGNNCQF